MMVLTAVVGAWAFVVQAVAARAIAQSLRRPTKTASSNKDQRGQLASESVVLVRPCRGQEPGLEANLTSASIARLSVPMRIVLAVEDTADPAYEALRHASVRLRGRDMTVRVLTTGAQGPNRKADQIARALAGASESVVIVADSDVDLAGCDLDALVSPLFAESVGATWAAPVETHPRTRADAASAAILDASLHAFALLSAIDPNTFVGKLMAIKSDALAAVGGFESFVQVLGEDMELSRRLHRLGVRTKRVNVIARSVVKDRSWGDVIRRYARWIMVIRAQRPWLLPAYPLLLAATPGIVCVSVIAAITETPMALVACWAAWFGRVSTALAARRTSPRVFRADILRDMMMADLVLLVAWLRALWTRHVDWRGQRLRVTQHGRLHAEAT